jgi:ribosomal-protein-alanine N-acetyltransferase
MSQQRVALMFTLMHRPRWWVYSPRKSAAGRRPGLQREQGKPAVETEQRSVNEQSRAESLSLARVADAVPIALMSRRLIEAGLPSWSWTARRVTRHIQDPESVVLTARRGDELTGFAIMGFGEEAVHLNLLAVERSCRRRGLGRRMVRWLEASAMVAGTFEVSLEVRATNLAARAFYRSLGYSEADLLPGYYERIEDAVRMTRDLRVVRIDQPI